jgi:NET1-associated nuclear protein 1 (U3 small nucleolar RNA-associated protein 17)
MKSTIRRMQVLSNGRVVIVTTNKAVFIGKRSNAQKTALREYAYVWREFHTSKPVTCFHAYVRESDDSAKGGKPSADSMDRIDLAVGDQGGAIWLFEDVLSAFTRIEKSRKDGSQTGIDYEMLRPKRLHWHREAVGAVRWSRDGMFNISEQLNNAN